MNDKVLLAFASFMLLASSMSTALSDEAGPTDPPVIGGSATGSAGPGGGVNVPITPPPSSK